MTMEKALAYYLADAHGHTRIENMQKPPMDYVYCEVLYQPVMT